ncbi:hypothetical protein [Thalassotalea profundi]|uniref:Uncharacterized protein n=1 Tax=Thalassotalea profundi TaxID=2036687 RepID=A0ABQ3J7F0_9GAMM|nr:hypothetical protein [Thalassotalea profundi]GHF02944.1 hypothetical protein GCM10011501_35240 [Thalassotalea profundi]
MKRTLSIISTLLIMTNASAEVPNKFPVLGEIKASQFDKSELNDKKEETRRASVKSVPTEQAIRCIAFTYGAHTLASDGKRKDWEEHLKYFHDYTSSDVYKILDKAERDMKSILAKTEVTWKDVHRTYYRECSGYWKISTN